MEVDSPSARLGPGYSLSGYWVELKGATGPDLQYLELEGYGSVLPRLDLQLLSEAQLAWEGEILLEIDSEHSELGEFVFLPFVLDIQPVSSGNYEGLESVAGLSP